MNQDHSSLHNIYSNTDNPKKEIKLPENIRKIMNKILTLIPSFAEKHDNKIPIRQFQEETNFSYEEITNAILNLIMEKKIIGFINDNGTKELSDDILIIREKRLIDELEGSYRTG